MTTTDPAGTSDPTAKTVAILRHSVVLVAVQALEGDLGPLDDVAARIVAALDVDRLTRRWDALIAELSETLDIAIDDDTPWGRIVANHVCGLREEWHRHKALSVRHSELREGVRALAATCQVAMDEQLQQPSSKPRLLAITRLRAIDAAARALLDGADGPAGGLSAPRADEQPEGGVRETSEAQGPSEAVCRCPTNGAGDIRCHNCGEYVNAVCWKCGTTRGDGPCPTATDATPADGQAT